MIATQDAAPDAMQDRHGPDPDIRFTKSNESTSISHAEVAAHHARPPDVGIGIQVLVPSPFGTGHNEEYYGEYLGHGQSKTVFQLHSPGERFHGHVLKIAKKILTRSPRSLQEPTRLV